MNDTDIPEMTGTESLVAVVVDAFMERVRRGEAPEVEDYARRHPQIAAILRHVLPALEVIGSSASGRSGSRSAGPAEIEPEAPLGDYRIVREVGRGGMGVVYQAVQISLGREVALKVLPFAAALDPRQLQRFKNEAEAAAHLHHTNIVPVYGVGSERGVHYYAMQYIEGQTVAAVIVELRRLAGLDTDKRDEPAGLAAGLTRELTSGRWAPAVRGAGAGAMAAMADGPESSARPEADGTPVVAGRSPASPSTDHSTRKPPYFRTVAHLGVQAARALEHAHSMGVIHRDIKPANLIVDTGGNIWITDFGLARLQGGAELTVTGDLVGTLRYMSPEQALGQRVVVDHRTDVYSLGMTLYELLALEPAFGGRDRSELLRQIAFAEPRRLRLLNEAVPADLETIVLKAIEKASGERYATAEELADDLQRFLDDRTIRARRPTIWERARKFTRRHRPAVATAAVAAVLLLVAVSVVASLAAVWLGKERDATLKQLEATQKAERARQRQLEATQKAERDGQHRLYEAKVAQAQASLWRERAGRRFEGLRALDEAAALARGLRLGPEAVLALRNEAIACMILPDLGLDQQWEASPPQSGVPIGIGFDAALERYARVEADGTVTVRGLADDAVLARITDLGVPARRVVDWRVLLRFSPDGRLLATRSDPYLGVPLQVWDLGGPRRLMTVPPWGAHFYRDFDFSPDSRILATGQADGSIGLYEVRSGRRLKSLAPGSFPTGLRFDPTGQKLAISRGSDPTIRILDLEGRPSGRPLTHPAQVHTTPAWHPDGVLLAGGCSNGVVYVWDTRTGKRVADCKGHRDMVIDVVFSHGGDLLASASWDGTTRLWDPRTGRQLVSAEGRSVAFSRDDHWLGWELGGPYVGRWEVATGHECRLFRGAGAQPAINSVDIHPDGRWLAAAGDDGVHLWDLSAGKEARFLPLGRTLSAIFDESGQSLLTSGIAGLYRWPARWNPDAPGGRLRLGPARAFDLPAARQPEECARSRDGQRLAVRTQAGELIFVDLARTRRRPRLVGGGLWSTAISPDGRWVVAGTWNGYACQVWDARTGRCLQDLPARNARTAFSPDDRWLVVATFEKYEFHRLDGDRWRSIRSLPRTKGASSPGLVAFTRDARMVALTDSVRSIRLLDTQQWREFATISAHDSEELTWLGFSPDGSRLAVGTKDGAIQLWDLRRIRARLRQMGLDWDPPAQPPRSDDDGGPARVDVDFGEVPQPERESLILAMSPFDAEAYFRRGLAYARRGQRRPALDDFRWALALKPDHAEALYRRGLVLALQRKNHEAIADWSRAIALEPDHAEARLARGDAYSRLSRWDEAAGDYARLVDLRPDWPEPYNNAAWMLAAHSDYRRRDIGRAIIWAGKAVELDPDEWMYWNTLGVVRYRAGDWRGAIEALERSVSFQGHNGYDDFFLAMSRWHLGERQEALRLYEQAVQWMQDKRPDEEELRRFRTEASESLRIGEPSRSEADKGPR
jgi:serine/threonine protein kinase/WD40 repeat protein/Flp pilus assembly protein TadD